MRYALWRATLLASVALLAPGCRSVKEPPVEYTALYDTAVEELRLKNYEAARASLIELSTRFPRMPLQQETRILLAGCEENLGNQAEAAAIYREILETDPDPATRRRVLQYLGLAERRLDNYKAAAAAFREALALSTDPAEKPDLSYRLGLVLQMDGSFAEARSIFQTIVRENPVTKFADLATARLLLPDHFSVQVGVFGQRDNAEAQAAALKEAGFPAEVTEMSSGGRRLYPVRVGQLARRQDALQMRRRLEQSSALPRGSELKVVP